MYENNEFYMKEYLERLDRLKLIQHDKIREMAIEHFYDSLDRIYLAGKITGKQYEAIYEKAEKIK